MSKQLEIQNLKHCNWLTGGPAARKYFPYCYHVKVFFNISEHKNMKVSLITQ